MKKPPCSPFDEYMRSLPAKNADKIKNLLKEADSYCLMSSSENMKIRTDFENALLLLCKYKNSFG